MNTAPATGTAAPISIEMLPIDRRGLGSCDVCEPGTEHGRIIVGTFSAEGGPRHKICKEHPEVFERPWAMSKAVKDRIVECIRSDR